MSTTIDTSPTTGPGGTGTPVRMGRRTRSSLRSSEGDIAFVASLAVGLASAAWDPERAAAELAAAAGDDLLVLDAARTRVLERFAHDRAGAVRASRLLARARVAATREVAS